MGRFSRFRRTFTKISTNLLGPHSCLLWTVVLVFYFSVVFIITIRSTSSNLVQLVPKIAMPISGETSTDVRNSASLPVGRSAFSMSMEEFWRGHPTGNPLVDDYGKNNVLMSGEQGRGVVLTVSQIPQQSDRMNKFHINTLVSDIVPLNRLVPDSRLQGCSSLTYSDTGLPKVTVIIPFYDEWPSLLLRTVYSVINRTPRHLLREILLVDDASTLPQLEEYLQQYLHDHFPSWLVRLLRSPVRKGLINARMRGVAESKGQVLVFFDSHMEVNHVWLEPLLTEIANDRKVVAMSTLDYIQPDTLEYRYNVNYMTRYAWDWRMVFFETFFRDDQIKNTTTSPRPGTCMVGAAFAMEKAYFLELGGYDQGMGIWGGENLEMSWRVWLCGGRLVHLPCSRIGHVARAQPYSFPGGRQVVEHYNYKRAIQVWMGQYAKFVYQIFPDMKDLDAGSVKDRLDLKKRLQCRDFSWYIKNVWPELNVYDENVTVWGRVENEAKKLCLDNADYLFQAQAPLYLRPCSGNLHSQGFSLKTNGALQTSLQCVVVPSARVNSALLLEDCLIGLQDRWIYTAERFLRHVSTNLCLDVDTQGPVLTPCRPSQITQKWTFIPVHLHSNPVY